MPTAGQVLIESVLPEDLRGKYPVLDKKAIGALLNEVAERHPDQYKHVLKGLMDVGRSVASTKGMSINLRSLLPSKAKARIVAKLRAENDAIAHDRSLTQEQREKYTVANTSKYYDKIQKAVFDEATANNSPYAMQIASGGRGNPGQLNSMIGSDLLVLDHKNQMVPVPIYSSYADGLDPVEYWAASYGTRKGLADTKFATAEAGFFGKQLALAAHRQLVTADRPKESRLPVGLLVDVADSDNEGSVLAKDHGDFKSGTILDSRTLEKLRRQGFDELLVASPMTSIVDGGGIDSWSAGRRERGSLAQLGDNVGITAAQSISEPMSQGMLDSKHRAGAGGERIKRSGFEYINRLFQGPEFFQESGPLSPVDGRVRAVEDAPQGGKFIFVGDERVYTHPSNEVTVKPGDKVEQGDDLTDGVPHPRELVKYLGVGEARRVMLKHVSEAMKDSGINVNRRNLEPIVAGLMNHVRITDPDGMGDHIVDDIVPYNTLLSSYKPRASSSLMAPKLAAGKYLEEPVLHYTPGTRMTKRMIRSLEKHGVQDIHVNDEPLDFEPHFERLMTATSHDPDWQTRLGGFYTQRSFMKALYQGATSDPRGTSYIPALAQGSGFGEQLKTKGTY